MTDSLFDRLVRLTESLRRAGIEVSTGELIDASTALAHLDVADRAALKSAMRATLVKSAGEVDRFDRLFDLTFRTQPPPVIDLPSSSQSSTPEAPARD